MAGIRAERCFQQLLPRLIRRIPDARIEHIGSTAVPGCLTKGDLDIVVRVSEAQFAIAEAALAAEFARNNGSDRSSTFAAFEDATFEVPVGIQLCVIGSKYDDFHRLRDVLRADARLVEEYNDLKRRFDGESMQQYRAAKSAWITEVLSAARRTSNPARPGS